MWTSGAGGIAGWVDMKIFDETGDAAKAQGWSPFVLDTNGNGKRDEYTEPNQPADAAKDARVTGGSGTYAVMPNPADGSIWYTVGVFAGRGGVMRYDPDTQLAEVFNVPMPGFGPRGGDIDSKGVVWVSLASGHIGSFDRSKCKAPLNGPKATGDHCPEGWAFYQYPGPGFQGIGENSAEASYYSWVDQTTRSGSARTCRSRPPTCRTALPRSRTARWCCCVCPIRSASTPRASMAASTIPTAAGRAAECGRRAVTARRG